MDLSSGLSAGCGASILAMAGGYLIGPTAFSRRDRRAMRTSFRMSQESTNLVGRFRREYVFELAGLLFNLGFVFEREAIGEQALG